MPITVSGTQITFNDGTNQTTAFTGSGGVTSLNGQTGAITNTNVNSIGSYAAALNYNLGTPAGWNPGGTYAASGLRTIPGGSDPFGSWPRFNTPHDPGYTGTWRAMSGGVNFSDACGTPYVAPALFVRIS